MVTLLDNNISKEGAYFQNTLPNYYRSVLKKFRKLSRSYVHFNLLFLALFLIEVTVFAISFPRLSHSVFFAVLASALFATCFSYLVILFYFQARKPEQLLAIKEEFLDSCRKLLSTPVGMDQHHLSVAEALTRLSSYLEDFEWEFYKPFSSSLISRFSAYCYWEDVFKTKQMLLTAAIDEHIKQIRITPTDLEVHASLGGTYVTLSKLYREPIQNPQHPRMNMLKKLQGQFVDKSNIYSRLAMEEFKILSHHACNDPWIHEQMAAGYKDLGLPEEETKEVEMLLKLRPQDKEILFRLGVLYFSQGLNAKGLHVYQELKKTNFKKAEDLISSYGAIPPKL